jgi:hypothetical protein
VLSVYTNSENAIAASRRQSDEHFQAVKDLGQSQGWTTCQFADSFTREYAEGHARAAPPHLFRAFGFSGPRSSRDNAAHV